MLDKQNIKSKIYIYSFAIYKYMGNSPCPIGKV